MPCTPANPLWLQFLVTAAPALLVGLLAWFVSRGQLHVSAEKLRHDLFERRFAIFYAFQVYMVASANNEATTEQGNEVVAKLAQARFLFDQPTFEYLRKTFMAVASLNNMGPHVLVEGNFASKHDQAHAQIKILADRAALFDQVDHVAARVAPQLRLRDFGPHPR